MEIKKENTSGGIIGVIIIIILLLIGAWYFFSERLQKIEEQKKMATSTIINIKSLSTSTEIQDINNDLQKINVSGLGN